MKTAIRFAVGFVVVSASFARDFRPDGRLENVPASNTSVQQCYIFRTMPGVLYRVESSHDLSNWTAGDEFYGMGHEVVTAMREYTPPPPAPPGTPPAAPPVLAIHASLRIRPSSGTAGGTVVSWKSLDHGGPVIMLLAQAMNSNWNQWPLYWERFGNHDFFIGCDGAAIPPPAENPVLGTMDAAMFAELETSFPAINLAVDESIARARNAPAPAQPDPNSRKFWRVFCDWGLDTDQDGSPDWAEFEMGALTTGGPTLPLRGDAFDADTDDDGIPDGEQLDYDQDGIADANDIAFADASATYPFGSLPRYALFPITTSEATDTPPSGQPAPIQISDKGTVLYQNGTWTAGAWTALADSGDGLVGATARAINDENVILGFATATGSDLPYSQICYWPDSDSNTAPTGVATGDSPPFLATTQSDMSGGPGYDLAYNILSPGPILSNDGHFHMGSSRKTGDHYTFEGYGLWQLPVGNQSTCTLGGAERGMRYLGDNNIEWGYRPLPNDPFSFKGGMIQKGGTSYELDFVPTNVAALPNNVLLAMSNDPITFAIANRNGVSETGTLYSKSIDISADGTAIGKAHEGKVAPILLNGQWAGIERTAPIARTTLEQTPEWNDASVTLLDTTPAGWILARRGPESTPEQLEYAAMIPIKARSQYVQQHLAGVTTDEYTGVDDFSIGSIFSVPAVKDSIWIMAPLEGAPKSVTFSTPVDGIHPLVLSADDIDFGNVAGKGYLYNRQSTCTMHAKTTAQSGNTRDVKLEFEDQASPAKPLALKVMKSRTVKVTLYKVTKQTPDKPNNTADQVPDAESLRKYLNDVFSPQVNVKFAVTDAPQPLVLDWDTNPDNPFDNLSGNGFLDCYSVMPSPEQTRILSAAAAGRAEGTNIDLFLFGTDKKLNNSAWGETLRIRPDSPEAGQVNACWIVGDPLENRKMGTLMQTIAHEIGHVLVGPGHPDETLARNRGPADLPGTDNTKRLMVSGNGFKILRGHLLVKQEWDAAEEWLHKNIDPPTQ